MSTQQISMDSRNAGTGEHPDQCPICGYRRPQHLLSAPDRFHGRTESYTLMRCPSCSLVWLDDPPPPDEMGRHYGSEYDRAIASGGEDPDHWRGRWKELLRYKSGGALLDLGCSSGGFLATMKGPAWKLFGIEMSQAVAEQAEARSGARIFVGDILDAPYPASSFDAITCFHVFEHLYQPFEVLRKVADWLKPGGVFYAMMPNIDSAGARIFRSYWYALELPRHLYHFSPVSLRRVCNLAGLEAVTVTARREVFIEASARYMVDEALHKCGVSRPPLAASEAPSLPWKVMRKALRLTVLPALSRMASIAGDGESIHAVFRKVMLPTDRSSGLTARANGTRE